MLEKEIAALAYFIKPIIQMQYFGELPEGIATPSVYFPVPQMHGNGHSLNSYKNSYTLFLKIFGRDSMDSYLAASEIINKIQLAGKMLPLYDMEGKLTGRTVLIKEALAKTIDVGVTQLTVEWDAFASYHHEESIKSGDLYFGGMAVSTAEKEEEDGKKPDSRTR